MSEYTPTTHEVRRSYRAPAESVDLTDPQREGEKFSVYLSRVAGVDAFLHQQASYAAFDRWLTEHDRQVANRAWMRCEAAIAGHLAGKSTITEAIATLWPANPYRKEQGNE